MRRAFWGVLIICLAVTSCSQPPADQSIASKNLLPPPIAEDPVSASSKPSTPQRLDYDLLGSAWNITGNDVASTSWDGSTLTFTSQVPDGTSYKLEGFFLWTGTSGSYGRENFIGTLSSDGALQMRGTQIVPPTRGALVTASYRAQLKPEENAIVNGNWVGGIPSNSWRAVKASDPCIETAGLNFPLNRVSSAGVSGEGRPRLIRISMQRSSEPQFGRQPDGSYLADLTDPRLAPLVADEQKYAPEYYGESHECVALVKEFTGLPCTLCWRKGIPVVGDDFILPGTAIATFDATGHYPKGSDKNSAIYFDSSEVNILIIDQWPDYDPNDGEPTPTASLRPIGDKPDDPSNNRKSYYVITVPDDCKCGAN